MAALYVFMTIFWRVNYDDDDDACSSCVAQCNGVMFLLIVCDTILCHSVTTNHQFFAICADSIFRTVQFLYCLS